MATQDEIATRPEGMLSEEERRFVIDAPVEIAQILESTVRKESPVSAFYKPDEYVLTAFLAVEPERDRLVFRLPEDPGQTALITSSQEIAFVTSQDRITIKFSVDRAETTTHDGQPALVSPLPSTLVRLQRREYFRVACPPGIPVTCAVPFTLQGQAQKAEITVNDLSMGGVSLIDQHPRLALKPGTVYKDCSFKLPDVGSFTATIEVVNSYQVTLTDGTVSKRSGCRFVKPPQDGLSKIQRYTMMREQRSAKVDRG